MYNHLFYYNHHEEDNHLSHILQQNCFHEEVDFPAYNNLHEEDNHLCRNYPLNEYLLTRYIHLNDYLVENYSALQRELGKRKWGLRVNEAEIQEKIKTCRGLAEELLQDEELSLEKRNFLEDNLKELRNLEKKQQP